MSEALAFRGNMVASASTPDVSLQRQAPEHENAPVQLSEKRADTAACPAVLTALCGPIVPGTLHLPLLEAALDVFPELLVARLRDSWGVTMTISAEALSSTGFLKYLSGIPETSLLGHFRFGNTPSTGLVDASRELVYLFLDCVLGARGSGASAPVNPRPYTAIESSLMQLATGHVLAALNTAVRPVLEPLFSFMHWEREPRKLAESSSDGGVLVLSLEIEKQGRSGRLRLALPFAMLEPRRAQLSGVFPGEKYGTDAAWRAHLGQELTRAPVEIEAVLYEALVPLSRVRSLKPGDTLSLDLPGDAKVELRSGGARLSEGRMGRSGAMIAIEVAQLLEASGAGAKS